MAQDISLYQMDAKQFNKAPDMITNPQIMARILDTNLSMQPPHERQANFHVVTGKPIESGGSAGRDKATGQGVVYLIERWANDYQFSLSGATYFVEGFGNVGSWTTRLMKRLGAVMVAVEAAERAIFNEDGIDPDDLLKFSTQKQGISNYPKAEAVDHRTFLRTEADIFVPAALENQITAKTAELLNVKMVAEGANGPTTPDGDRVLFDKEIFILPDILCNSGGVIVSYFEWLQNKRAEFWHLDEVDAKLHRLLMRAYDRVQGVLNCSIQIGERPLML